MSVSASSSQQLTKAMCEISVLIPPLSSLEFQNVPEGLLVQRKAPTVLRPRTPPSPGERWGAVQLLKQVALFFFCKTSLFCGVFTSGERDLTRRLVVLFFLCYSNVGPTGRLKDVTRQRESSAR